MTKKQLTFVSFGKTQDKYQARVPLSQFMATEMDFDKLLGDAGKSYGEHISKMRSIVAEIKGLRDQRKLVPASLVWSLGDKIFALVKSLEALNLQIDGLYEHLERDLGVKRKWLEKVVILRRYVTNQDRIPKSLNWGRCEKGTRRVAQKIQDGTFVL